MCKMCSLLFWEECYFCVDITIGKKSQLQLVMSHLLSFGIEVWWVDVDSLKKRWSPREVFKSSNLLGPPLGGAIWPGGANDLHLPTDRPAKGLAAGSQVDPGVHVLELDRLVALPVVCVAHHLSKTCIFSSLLGCDHPPSTHLQYLLHPARQRQRPPAGWWAATRNGGCADSWNTN